MMTHKQHGQYHRRHGQHHRLYHGDTQAQRSTIDASITHTDYGTPMMIKLDPKHYSLVDSHERPRRPNSFLSLILTRAQGDRSQLPVFLREYPVCAPLGCSEAFPEGLIGGV